MRTGHLFGFISASLLLVALTLVPGSTRAADNQSLSPEEQQFLTKAAADNATQIAMAKLALQKSQNQKVIDLANTVIQERTALNAQLAQLSQDTANAPPTADSTASLNMLQGLNGDAFDRSFAGIVVRDHNRIISAYQCIKASSTNVALHSVVHKAVADLRGNLMVALGVLRSSEWAPASHQQALTSVDTHTARTSYMGEPMSSFVAAPW
ncbi:DUF4142 domain-containing protein [Dyella acidiphila]|uniref:DUF4142 domain-containing protein n=1 Tax=Dyella acidiphila TaxID=2775866 RepID=A0ABR9GEC5_9GAMM|nr:DUF4142 domain-containing protein [Dyella acidiphila]MBE1162404.1 DUF4142 domain-containing protein [Dyella acidiphila]